MSQTYFHYLQRSKWVWLRGRPGVSFFGSLGAWKQENGEESKHSAYKDEYDLKSPPSCSNYRCAIMNTGTFDILGKTVELEWEKQVRKSLWKSLFYSEGTAHSHWMSEERVLFPLWYMEPLWSSWRDALGLVKLWSTKLISTWHPIIYANKSLLLGRG